MQVPQLLRQFGYKLPSAKKSKYRDWEIFNTPVENP